MRGGDRNIPVCVSISTIWSNKRRRLQAVEMLWCLMSWHGWLGALFLFFLRKNPIPSKVINTLLYLFCIATWRQHSLSFTCSTMEDEGVTNCSKSRGKTPVGRFIAIKVFRYLNNPSNISILHSIWCFCPAPWVQLNSSINSKFS